MQQIADAACTMGVTFSRQDQRDGEARAAGGCMQDADRAASLGVL